MSGWMERVRSLWERRQREADEAGEEQRALEDELMALGNEARFQEEPAYAADIQRKRDELERETRTLFYETKEPQRSMAQGRCQRLLEEIERRDAVQARIAEVKKRLAELGERFPVERDAADTGDRVAS